MGRYLWTECNCVREIGLNPSKEIIPVRENPRGGDHVENL